MNKLGKGLWMTWQAFFALLSAVFLIIGALLAYIGSGCNSTSARDFTRKVIG